MISRYWAALFFGRWSALFFFSFFFFFFLFFSFFNVLFSIFFVPRPTADAFPGLVISFFFRVFFYPKTRNVSKTAVELESIQLKLYRGSSRFRLRHFENVCFFKKNVISSLFVAFLCRNASLVELVAGN